MKKSTKVLVSVLCVMCVAALALGLVACTGASDGLSAYEIAVQNGFSGTEKEWLESLKTTINQTDVIYNVEDSSDDAVTAANIGLKSVVSVYANFTKTVTVGFGFHYQSQDVDYTSAGAGVIYRLEENGSAFVVTNYHVVYSADSKNSDKISSDISLYLYGSEISDGAIAATYVGGSLQYDIAVLRVENSSVLAKAEQRGVVSAVTFDDSDEVVAGQTCFAIGNPEANGISVTKGIISVDSEYITLTGADDQTQISIRVMRTDTGVNSGNSGGGLFNAEGKLIGIVNAKMNTSKAENIAYAIPSNLVNAIAANIIDNCYGKSNKNVLRPMLGVDVKVADAYSQADDEGALHKVEVVEISSVTKGGASDGLLEVGDTIKSVTIGEKTITITRSYMFTEALLNAREGDTVTIVVERNGTETTVQVSVGAEDIEKY